MMSVQISDIGTKHVLHVKHILNLYVILIEIQMLDEFKMWRTNVTDSNIV